MELLLYACFQVFYLDPRASVETFPGRVTYISVTVTR